jgi:hypothetical protein
MAKSKRLHLTTGFGHRTRQPFVSLQVGDEFTQMTPDKAREVASMLFAAAEAADSDGFLMTWSAGFLGADDTHRAALLQEFRQYRAQYTGHPPSWSPLEDEDPPG